MALSTFRRNAAVATKKKGGKGMRGNWRDKLHLPKDTPTPFIAQSEMYKDPNPDPSLIEVDIQTGQPKDVYSPYFKGLKHVKKLPGQGYGGKDRYIDEICSAGWNPHAQQPCIGCMAEASGDKSIRQAEFYAIGIIHLAPYHRVPLFDREKGWIMKKENQNEPVLTDEECEGKTCNFCRILQGQQPIVQQGSSFPPYQAQWIQTVFGSRRYMEMGPNHLEDLTNWDQQIGSVCCGPAYARDPQGNFIMNPQTNQPFLIAGKCSMQLGIEQFVCENCNTPLIDVANDPRPVEELVKMALGRLACPKCQRLVFAKEIDSCDIHGDQPVVETLFGGNIVCWGMKQGEQKNSHLVLSQFETIDEFEAKHPEVKQILQGKPLKERIGELNKPYDFDALFKPKDLEGQAKRLQYQYSPAPQQQMHGGFYGGQQPQGYPQGGVPQQGGYPQGGGYPQQPMAQPMAQPMQPYPGPSPMNGAPAFPTGGYAPQVPGGFPAPSMPNFSK